MNLAGHSEFCWQVMQDIRGAKRCVGFTNTLSTLLMGAAMVLSAALFDFLAIESTCLGSELSMLDGLIQ